MGNKSGGENIKSAEKESKSIGRNIFSGILVVFISVLFALFLRIFIFASYHIPSASMKPTIIAGDYILVNKLIPGPRIFKGWRGFDSNNSKFYRVPGIRNIKKNDVLVFNYPFYNLNSFGDDKIILRSDIHYIKRCVAVPGDTFYIENAICKVKGFIDSLAYLTAQKALGDMPVEKFKPGCFHCFPHDTVDFDWNAKNFGPLYIPGKGDTIQINSRNITLYGNLIRYETNKQISFKDSVIYLGESELKKYIFEKNYYFMVGDHIKDSHDSRFWGLLPEDHIIGKAEIIWKSQKKKTGKYRWERFFKTVN